MISSSARHRSIRCNFHVLCYKKWKRVHEVKGILLFITHSELKQSICMNKFNIQVERTVWSDPWLRAIPAADVITLRYGFTVQLSLKSAFHIKDLLKQNRHSQTRESLRRVVECQEAAEGYSIVFKDLDQGEKSGFLQLWLHTSGYTIINNIKYVI